MVQNRIEFDQLFPFLVFVRLKFLKKCQTLTQTKPLTHPVVQLFHTTEKRATLLVLATKLLPMILQQLSFKVTHG